MKKIIIYSIICVLLFLIPLTFKTKNPSTTSTKPLVQPDSCSLLITANNETIPIEDYLIGVLAGEMPASFDSEALKAQATVARTYTLYFLQNFPILHCNYFILLHYSKIVKIFGSFSVIKIVFS